MKLRIHEHDHGAVAEVTLSRRNLLALLHKLEMPGSARTLMTDYDCPDGWVLAVRSEPDDEHYGQRLAPPGPLHPASKVLVSVSGNELRSSEQPGCEKEQEDDNAELRYWR